MNNNRISLNNENKNNLQNEDLNNNYTDNNKENKEVINIFNSSSKSNPNEYYFSIDTNKCSDNNDNSDSYNEEEYDNKKDERNSGEDSSSSESCDNEHEYGKSIDHYISKSKNSLSYNDNLEWRVKYYKLLNSGSWKDVSTGMLKAYVKEEDIHIYMIDEKNNEEIFNFCIKDYDFVYQSESILTWKSCSTLETNDNAVSFQDSKGLLELCSLIIENYGESKINKCSIDNILAEIEVQNLPIIAKQIRSDQNSDILVKIVEKLISDNCDFFDKMFDILKEEETKYNNIEIEKKTVKSISISNSTNENTNKQLNDICTNSINNKNNYEYLKKANSSDFSKSKNYNVININNNLHRHNNPIIESLSSEIKDYKDYQSCISNNIIEKHLEYEDTDNVLDIHSANLKLIFIIYKNLFSIANQNLIEVLISDKNYLGTFAALECKN